MDGGQGGDEARFLFALDGLASAWMLWIVVPDLTILVDVLGHEVGFAPTTWLFTPYVLLALVRLRAAAPPPVVRGFTTVLVVAGVTAAVDVARSIFAGNDTSSAVPSAVMLLVMVGLGVFSLAMARWTAVVPADRLGPEGDGLDRAWRRSARWAGAGAATLAGLSVARAVQLLVADRPLSDDWALELDLSFWLMAPFLAVGFVVLLGPLFSVAGSTGRTRRALEPIVTIRRRAAAPG